jgi:hypothetical protein
MVLNKKLRRHSGRVTPRLIKGAQIKNLIEEGLEPQVYWDDWKDYRDGLRGSKDRKMLRNENTRLSKYFDVKRWNKKLKALILRRKVKKIKSQNL